MDMQARGPILGSVLGACRLIAASHAFALACDASTPEQAARHIKRWRFRDAPEMIQAARPFAAVWPASSIDFDQYAGGQQNWLTGHGSLVVVLTDKDRHPQLAEGARDASGDEFADWVDCILADVRENAGKDDYLDLRRISFLRPPVHSDDWVDPGTIGAAFWDCHMLWEWGSR